MSGWEGTWTTPPASSATDASDDLVVTCVGGSDFWRTTYYGFERDSGHALLAPFADGRSLEVTFVADLEHQYDQAGLVVRADDRHWVKAGLELSDGVPQLGAVVTDEVSDWSCGAVPEWLGATVTVRVSWTRGALLVRARADGGPWRLVRLAPWRHASASAGLFAAAPDRAPEGPPLAVRFTSVVVGDADPELHLGESSSVDAPSSAEPASSSAEPVETTSEPHPDADLTSSVEPVETTTKPAREETR